ncbi:unnamed protein product [Heterobilharzia americana]|nr:unnamed protein product [Heterobilharzia americana]
MTTNTSSCSGSNNNDDITTTTTLATANTTANDNVTMLNSLQDETFIVNPHFHIDISSSSSSSLSTTSTTTNTHLPSSGLSDHLNTETFVTVQAPFSRPVKPAIFNDDLVNTVTTTDKLKSSSNMATSRRSIQSETSNS